jgi:hypothetical protein
LTGLPPALELCWPVAERAPDEGVDVMASFVSRHRARPE